MDRKWQSRTYLNTAGFLDISLALKQDVKRISGTYLAFRTFRLLGSANCSANVCSGNNGLAATPAALVYPVILSVGPAYFEFVGRTSLPPAS
jgi:hypothetical protein